MGEVMGISTVTIIVYTYLKYKIGKILYILTVPYENYNLVKVVY